MREGGVSVAYHTEMSKSGGMPVPPPAEESLRARRVAAIPSAGPRQRLRRSASRAYGTCSFPFCSCDAPSGDWSWRSTGGISSMRRCSSVGP